MYTNTPRDYFGNYLLPEGFEDAEQADAEWMQAETNRLAPPEQD